MTRQEMLSALFSTIVNSNVDGFSFEELREMQAEEGALGLFLRTADGSSFIISVRKPSDVVATNPARHRAGDPVSVHSPIGAPQFGEIVKFCGNINGTPHYSVRIKSGRMEGKELTIPAKRVISRIQIADEESSK